MTYQGHQGRCFNPGRMPFVRRSSRGRPCRIYEASEGSPLTGCSTYHSRCRLRRQRNGLHPRAGVVVTILPLEVRTTTCCCYEGYAGRGLACSRRLRILTAARTQSEWPPLPYLLTGLTDLAVASARIHRLVTVSGGSRHANAPVGRQDWTCLGSDPRRPKGHPTDASIASGHGGFR